MHQKDHTVVEVSTTLKEWHQIWISLYLEKPTYLFDTIATLINELVDLRNDLIDLLKLCPPLESDTAIVNNKYQQMRELKGKIVRKLDHGNRLLNLDLVPRDANYDPILPAELSPIKLHQLHIEASNKNAVNNNNDNVSYESVDLATSANNRYSHLPTRNSFRSPSQESYLLQKSSHLQFAIKDYHLFFLGPEELFEIYFTIVEVNNSTIKPITDKFLVQLKGREKIYGLSNTVFTNLGTLTDRELYLQVQVYRIGSMTLVETSKVSFSKQQSTSNIQASNASQDGSNQSIDNSNKYAPNGLSKSYHSNLNQFSNQTYKRPFGSTIISLSDILKQREPEASVKIYTCTEIEFPIMQELILKRQHNFKNNPNSSHIHLDLIFKDLLCNESLLTKFCPFQPFCKTEKRGFPDIVMPGDFKNDLYLALESGEFEKGGKSIPKNIEASISLIDRKGIAIQDCISPGSNCDNLTCYKSSIFYHSNSPKWNEDIKIKVPLSEFDNAHIRIEFRHCSTREKEKKFLGFSFLPLSDEDGAVISDKQHELYLYKCDPKIWEEESLNLCSYTSSPYGPDQLISRSNLSPHSTHFTHSNRELITVSTFLLSTKLTQNRNLLSLLKWRELVKRGSNEIEEALKKVLTLDGEEIVKFLQDILDTLFDTFTIYSVSEGDPKKNYSALIFKVLVHVFTLLDDPKYRHFQQVVDTYVSAHFSATLVYRGLLLCLKQCVDYSSNVEKHPPIQRCFKSMRFIFQFVVQSRVLYLKATGEQNDKSFINDLFYLFNSFEQMLSTTNPDLLPIQVTILESFPGTYCHLIKVMSVQELIKVVDILISTIGHCSWSEALLKAKLTFMKETACSEIIKSQEDLLMVIEMFCPQLVYHMNKPEEPELCQEILRELLDRMHEFHWPSLYRRFEETKKQRVDVEIEPIMTAGGIRDYIAGAHDKATKIVGSVEQQTQLSQIDLIMESLSRELEPMMQVVDLQVKLLELAVQHGNTNSEKILLQKYCTNLLTILKLMSETNYEQYMKQRVNYFKLCDLFRAFRGVFNRDWSVMQLTTTSILEHSLEELSKLLLSEIETQHHSINRHLGSYIVLVVDFITHPALQLETFSTQKRNYILKTFGDLRIKFGHQLMKTWENLAPANIYALLPTFVKSILNVTLLPIEELQKKLIPTFYDMMDAEYQLKSEFGQLSRCFIDDIEVFMHLDRGSARFIRNFKNINSEIIAQRAPLWKDRGLALVSSLEKLLWHLLEYRQSLALLDNTSYKMNCLVNLLNFYKQEHDRSDLYAKYVFKLSQMHIVAGNHVEAAMTLKLYSSTLDWTKRRLSCLEEYQPEEEEWQRKEIIYHKMIHYFDLGKCWEEAIDLCKDLAYFYETCLGDFEKLSNILKKLAQFIDNILTQIRPEREYFRVEFFGAGSPSFLRDKEFVFRGAEYERLPEFMQRMLNEFSDATILNSKTRQNFNKDSPGRYIVISNVKPKPSLNDNFKLDKRHSDKIIHYYLNNRINIFSYDKPLIKQTINRSNNKENDLESRWVERTMLKLPNQLPSILTWCEVCERETIEISPLNHAIETISSMNLELSKLILSYKNDQNKQISPLTMRLQGVIDAAVNGGPTLIISTFLKPPDISPPSKEPGKGARGQIPDTPELVSKLKELVIKQFSILEKGLELHSRLAPPEVLPLHARLEERLKATKGALVKENGASAAAASTPVTTPAAIYTTPAIAATTSLTNNYETNNNYDSFFRTHGADALMVIKNMVDI